MENQEDWSCDANEAVQVSLVQRGVDQPNTLSTFNPQYTYPIVGDEETIFGYKGLDIHLRFAAHDLTPNILISYDEKFPTVGDVAAVDLNKQWKEWMPESSFKPLEEFKKSIQSDDSAKDFVPPGKLVHSYSGGQDGERSYEIWAGQLSDPSIRDLLDRLQVFVSFFIEAGTPIPTDDPDWTLARWTVYFIYEKTQPPVPEASPYSFVGYATTYRLYYLDKDSKSPHIANESFPLPSIDVTQLPARLRISQFLILPPHQGTGHGTHLYVTIQNSCVADPTVNELTVEDPNEAFDALRDTVDFHVLRSEFIEHNVTINPTPYDTDVRRNRPRLMPTSSIIPTKTLHAIRRKNKIEPTQFAHVLEMFLLGQIPPKSRGGGINMASLLTQKWRLPNDDDKKYYWWRMLVKQRLYKRHKDMLIQVDVDERVEKLEQTLANVEEGYDNLLKAFMVKEAAVGKEGGDDAPPGDARARTKRKLVVEEEDEDDDEDEKGGDGDAKAATGENGSRATKKQKTEE